MASPVYVVGVGMTKFIKPRGQVDYPEMGFEAGVKALSDAGINYDEVDQGVACYAYGDSTCGQRVFYQFGMTGIPIYNVNNNCSTGSTGLFMARQFCSSGLSNVSLVIGFEKMFPGSLQTFFKDRTNPLDKTYKSMLSNRGIDPKAPGAAQLFGNAGREYMEKFGATREDFAEIARVNHEHSQRNPYSQFKDVYTLEQILNSPSIHEPLTKLQCCPTSDGAAAAVLVSQKYLDLHPELKDRAILIAGQSLTTDSPALYNSSAIELVGADMTRRAAKVALSQAGVAARDIKLVELHDCFSANEMVTIDALGLCEPGKAHEMVRKGDITYGGRCVINPSGGLISKGHPLGATGLAQCCELVWQLRGWAGERNVEGVEAALQQNLGLGGAAVVTVYKRADGGSSRKVQGVACKIAGRGYNPAVEARGLSKGEIEIAMSRKASSKYMLEGEKKESRL
ncbi:Similar to Non-specific lipid-transfer protein; acc. no. Q07598 [Pyronema omphalodes CBS 100304]|uniref:propanoyl-CoA C-acyltransferase n=1 Tax=Pyronema omphalodes (strain CBS 100304) TaxID=1076935 RepID=U4KUS7_PYROM|nr:Similar to Non-specific lipid-transfer protein; acc. no. Q07598 [Pyronema omphalodes CBS 100304]